MIQSWDANIALCAVEDACVRLKSLIADGSMLRGHTAKKLADIDQVAVGAALLRLEAMTKHLITICLEEPSK